MCSINCTLYSVHCCMLSGVARENFFFLSYYPTKQGIKGTLRPNTCVFLAVCTIGFRFHLE